MKSDNKNEMSKTRGEKKKEIIAKLESLQSDLEDYLEIWKKTGGGTTGHIIGSMMSSIEEQTEFFKNRC